MKKKTSKSETGFALIMVLIMIAVAVVVGGSYLWGASIKSMSSHNLANMTRAKYLAESALHHATYLCKSHTDLLQTTSPNKMLGPYYVDETDDHYHLYAVSDPVQVGNWTLVGKGSSGTLTQTATARVSRTDMADATGGKSIITSGRPITIPASVKVFGDIAVDGGVTNRGYVDGEITYTTSYAAVGSGSTTQTPVKVESVSVPIIRWNDYKRYSLGRSNYDCIKVRTLYLTNDVVPETMVSPDNPGGVIWLEATSGNIVFIGDDLKFTGTIICNQDIVFMGTGIKIKAVKGFPAIVGNSRCYLGSTTQTEIQGLVYASRGFERYLTASPESSMKITGGFISGSRGFDSTIQGDHQIVYSQNDCLLYDISGNGTISNNAQVKILQWED